MNDMPHHDESDIGPPASHGAWLRDSGFTFLELVITITILSILTAAAVPMVRNSVKREREIELRLALRQLRTAIDAYHHYNEFTGGNAIPIELRTPSGYPKDLNILVDGFIPANVVGTSGAKVRFLRRIPIDPMTGNKEWGLRGYKDEPDSTSWGEEDVFDVYTKSDGQALNGTKYRDW
ncbi:MAG TPA: type II secretion system protein [Blastocatellia bacterium]|nr:type II secretion system protein [Blastocatellia bacterium]